MLKQNPTKLNLFENVYDFHTRDLNSHSLQASLYKFSSETNFFSPESAWFVHSTSSNQFIPKFLHYQEAK